MQINSISDSVTSVAKTMLTPWELSARTGIALQTLANWRVRRNYGEEIGPKFVKVSGRGGQVRYMIQHVEEWEAALAESAA